MTFTEGQCRKDYESETVAACSEEPGGIDMKYNTQPQATACVPVLYGK